MSDPIRLLSSSRDGVARALLESAVTPGPTDAQCDDLWSSLASRLPQAVVVGGAAGAAGGALAKAATSKAIGVGLFVKGAVIVGSLVAAGVAGHHWLSRTEAASPAVASASLATSPPPSPPRLPSPPIAPAPAPLTPSLPVADESTPPRPEPIAPSKAAPRASTARKPSPITSDAPPAPAPPVEIESPMHAESASLLRGRQLLRAGDCDAALAQLKETGTRFPQGALAQEREVLSIEALACAGRAAEASTRAEAFVRAYPTSPHAGKVRRFTR